MSWSKKLTKFGPLIFLAAIFLFFWLKPIVLDTFFQLKPAAVKWYFTSRDHQVLENFYQAVADLRGGIILMEINSLNKFSGLSLTLPYGVGKSQVAGVSFDGFDVSHLAKTTDRDGQVKVKFFGDQDQPEGVHYLMVRYYDPSLNNDDQSAVAALLVNARQGPNQPSQLFVDRQAAKIFGRLHKTQQEIYSLAAGFTARLQDHTPPAPAMEIDFEGEIKAIGWDRFRVRITGLPTVRLTKDGPKQPTDRAWQEQFFKSTKTNRNSLTGLNLAAYFDYPALLDNYSWEHYEEDQKTILRGRAGEFNQRPYMYLIEINKRTGLPRTIQTFIDQETVFGQAIIKYRKQGGFTVPIRQETALKYTNRRVRNFILELGGGIELNKIPLQREGMI